MLQYRDLKKQLDRNDLILGYQQFAEVNLEYAEKCVCADNEVLADCEEKLSESE